MFLFNLQPKRACTPPAGILFRVLAKQVRILNRIESRFHPVGRSPGFHPEGWECWRNAAVHPAKALDARGIRFQQRRPVLVGGDRRQELVPQDHMKRPIHQARTDIVIRYQPIDRLAVQIMNKGLLIRNM